MPDECPVCGTAVERPADEVMRYCPNVSCPGRVLEGIVHFASREAMDIRGLGYERVRQLLDARLIGDVADLYEVRADQLVELDRFAEQSAALLVKGIADSKSRPLSTLLFGLGIRHVGKTVAVLLARQVRHAWRRCATRRSRTINAVPGVGPDHRRRGPQVLPHAAEPPPGGATRGARTRDDRAGCRRSRTARSRA